MKSTAYLQSLCNILSGIQCKNTEHSNVSPIGIAHSCVDQGGIQVFIRVILAFDKLFRPKQRDARSQF